MSEEYEWSDIDAETLEAFEYIVDNQMNSGELKLELVAKMMRPDIDLITWSLKSTGDIRLTKRGKDLALWLKL